MDGHVVFQRQAGGSVPHFVGDGVRRVGGDCRNDEGVVFPAGDEVTGIFQPFFVRAGIGRGEFEDGFPSQGAQPGLGGGFGDFLFKVVHVGKGRDARADEFRGGDLSAEVNEFRRDEFAFHRHDVAQQPDIQPQVVGEAAQQCHGHVGVGVDQAGGKHLAAAVVGFGRGVSRGDFGFRADGHDGVAAHGHRAGFVNVEVGIHRQHDGVGE